MKFTQASALMAAALLAGATPITAMEITEGVIAGGGTPTSGGGFSIRGTAGQAAVFGSAGGSNMVCSGYWCQGGILVVSVPPRPPDDPGLELPKTLAFSNPMPNPSRGNVAFNLALPEASRIRLDVFDVTGRLVSSATEREFEAGHHRVEWHARHSGGAGPGVYFARLVVNDRREELRRIVIVK